MFPDITTVSLDALITDSTTATTSIDSKIDYKFDFDLGDFVVMDGSLYQIQDVEEIKMFIRKSIKTEKYKFKIYEHEEDTDEYGVTLGELMGQVLPKIIFESNIKDTITNALLKHNRILSLTDWNIEQAKSKFIVNFTVNMIDGVSFGEEVVI